MRILLSLLFLLVASNSSNNVEQASNDDLKPLLNPILRANDLPALAAAVVTSAGIRASAAIGVRKYGTDSPVTLDDQFHLGSDTKAMTATLMALLVERGKLSWDMTLAQCLPELEKEMNAAYRDVTLERLLAHRAGLTDESWPVGESFSSLHAWRDSPSEQRWKYAKMILNEAPGKSHPGEFLYSNRSYAIAGVIAERITGTPWEELMTNWLFKPLQMDTCGFGPMGTPGKIDQPLQHTLIVGIHRALQAVPESDNPVVIAPAGLVHCSIGDWGKFIQAHLRGEKGLPGILKAATFQKLHTAKYGNYGFGWMMLDRSWGGHVLTHAGSNNQNFAVVWMAPSKDFAVLAATNQGGDSAAKACDQVSGEIIKKYLLSAAN